MPIEDHHHGVEDTPVSQRLTNDDFRKLLMTPRATPSSRGEGIGAGGHPTGSIREAMAAGSMAPPSVENKSELRRKKKSFYAALKKQEDSKLAELAEKYRDRARERRDTSDGGVRDDASVPGASGAYRAVAPDLKSGLDAKERRRQMIQESKYLGGDMEHTHLVKGLDYALLQKVRSEIQNRELEREREMEILADAEPLPEKETPKQKEKERKEPIEEIQFKSSMGRNVFETVAAFKSKIVQRNELFAPGRMAYVIEVETDENDMMQMTDIPTTLVRSKADVPMLGDHVRQLTTNDIVIDKLAQILSYLRHGGRHGKRGRKIKEKGSKPMKPQDDSIYGEIGDYAPVSTGNKEQSRNDRDKGRDDKKKANSYFDRPSEKDREEEPLLTNAGQTAIGNLRSAALLSRLAAEPEGYAECYPGLREMDDAIDDSDDEVDYTKMDAGNRKGPIGRWDFDTPEEYSAYMSSKEALPKAAFQYGVKTGDGRKTRKTNTGPGREKGELDREWQQIQNIIQKRKTPRDKDEPNFKTPKY